MKPRSVIAIALLLCLPKPATAADDRADGVWAPFVPLKVDGGTIETLKHRFTVGESALPSQVFIKPDIRELPLALRAAGAKPTDTALAAIGRGSRLRAPMRLEAEVQGKRVAAQVTRPARAFRQAKGKVAYRAGLAVGPFDVDLDVQYECDGAMTVKLTYERARKPAVGTLELVIDLAGPVDLAYRPPPADPKTGAVSV
ncbi:MAG TPA: glycoside hydrolase domain-containing protein, partial [Phycisphaerae bacterium]|nr:glycoside hydrolase domain-containing protein [Phycisphaerae bacterium]